MDKRKLYEKVMISCIHFQHKIRIVRIFFSEQLLLYIYGGVVGLYCSMYSRVVYIIHSYKNFLIQSVKDKRKSNIIVEERI